MSCQSDECMHANSWQLGFWDIHCCGEPTQHASSPPLCLVHQCRSSQFDGVGCVPLPLCGQGVVRLEVLIGDQGLVYMWTVLLLYIRHDGVGRCDFIMIPPVHLSLQIINVLAFSIYRDLSQLVCIKGTLHKEQKHICLFRSHTRLNCKNRLRTLNHFGSIVMYRNNMVDNV